MNQADRPPHVRRSRARRRTGRDDDLLADLGRRRASPRARTTRSGASTSSRSTAGSSSPSAAEASRAQPRARGRREDALLPALSVRAAGRTCRRVLDGRPLSDGARAIAERLPHRVERKSLHARRQGARRAPWPTRAGKQRRHHPRPRRPAAGERATRDELRCRGRARSAHGEGARHGVVAGVRPQRRGESLRQHRQHHGELHPCRTAAQPRECRALHPGLDVQGDHGLRSARVEEVRTGVEVLRPRLLHGLREAGPQLRRPGRARGLRDDQPRHGPRALRQLGVLQHRPEARRQGDPRHGEALRLLRAPAARDSRGRAPPEWALSQRQALLPEASTRTSTPGAWRSARSGCS